MHRSPPRRLIRTKSVRASPPSLTSKIRSLATYWKRALLSVVRVWLIGWLRWTLCVFSFLSRASIQRETDPLLLWVRNKLPKRPPPQDLGPSWKDGTLAWALVDSLVPGACKAVTSRPRDNWSTVVNALETRFGLKCGVPIEDLCQGRESQVIGFLSQLRAASQTPMSPPPKPKPKVKLTTEAKGLGLLFAVRGRIARFSVVLASGTLDLVVDIRGPRNTQCTERLSSRSPRRKLLGFSSVPLADLEETYRGTIPFEYETCTPGNINIGYIPLTVGPHLISVIWQGEHVSGSPFTVNVDDSIEAPLLPSSDLTEKLIHHSSLQRSYSDPTKLLNKPAARLGNVTRKRVIRHVMTVEGKETDVSDLLAAGGNFKPIIKSSSHSSLPVIVHSFHDTDPAKNDKPSTLFSPAISVDESTASESGINFKEQTNDLGKASNDKSIDDDTGTNENISEKSNDQILNITPQNEESALQGVSGIPAAPSEDFDLNKSPPVQSTSNQNDASESTLCEDKTQLNQRKHLCRSEYVEQDEKDNIFSGHEVEAAKEDSTNLNSPSLNGELPDKSLDTTESENDDEVRGIGPQSRNDSSSTLDKVIDYGKNALKEIEDCILSMEKKAEIEAQNLSLSSKEATKKESSNLNHFSSAPDEMVNGDAVISRDGLVITEGVTPTPRKTKSLSNCYLGRTSTSFDVCDNRSFSEVDSKEEAKMKKCLSLNCLDDPDSAKDHRSDPVESKAEKFLNRSFDDDLHGMDEGYFSPQRLSVKARIQKWEELFQRSESVSSSQADLHSPIFSPNDHDFVSNGFSAGHIVGRRTSEVSLSKPLHSGRKKKKDTGIQVTHRDILLSTELQTIPREWTPLPSLPNGSCRTTSPLPPVDDLEPLQRSYLAARHRENPLFQDHAGSSDLGETVATEDERAYIDDDIPDYAQLTMGGDYVSYTGLLSSDKMITHRHLLSSDDEGAEEEVDGYLTSDETEPPLPFPGRCRASGSGLRFGQVGVRNRFKVFTKGAGRGSLTVNIQGTGKHDVIETILSYAGRDAYEVMYEVAQPGYYVITVRWCDWNIPESPFICKVTY